MDNLSNVIHIVERIEISPHNADWLYKMDYFKIMSILNNQKNHKTLDTIFKHKSMVNKNFKFGFNDIFVIKNRDVYDYLTKNNYRSDYSIILNQTLIDINNINYYLINYNENNYNYFIIVVSIDVSKLDKNFYDNFNLDNKDKNNKLFVSYLLTLMKYHFEEINNLRNESCENSLISKLISENTVNYMFDKMIEQPTILKSNLFQYQKANIYWMQNRENNLKKVILDDTRIVNWGPELEFNFSTLKFAPKRKVDTMPSDKLNNFLGGCLCDDVGLGKTIQILTLCFSSKTNNLIIVPNHLIKHWDNEIQKHIIMPENHDYCINNVIHQEGKFITNIVTYDKIKELTELPDFDRIIVDEYHEVFSNKSLREKLEKINSKYKWAVTATPFINKEMIHNILNFIAKNKIANTNISKYKMYINLFADMFRKNTKRTIEKELKLPKIKEISYYLKFSEKEKLYYTTLINNNKEKLEQLQRYFCINPSLYFTENNMGDAGNNFVEINLMEDKIKNMHKEQFDMEFLKLMELKKSLVTGIIKIIHKYKDDVVKEFEGALSKKEIKLKDIEEIINKDSYLEEDNNKIIKAVDVILEVLIKHDMLNKTIVNNIHSQTNIVENIKKTMVYFENQIKEINDSTEIVKSEENEKINYVKVELEKDCGICMGEIEEKFTILQCGHMYCTECISAIMQTTLNKCPTCKLSLKNTTIYAINNESKKISKNVTDMINMYGTKITNLINICKGLESKTVVFSFSPTLLSNIRTILNANSINSIYLTNDMNTSEVINNFCVDDTKVLILSSDFNASGLNITCASNIIILEPLKKDYMYRRQIENQIIGRLHRIGQDKEINFIRMIMLDSIEHDIDKENKINDAIYINKEFDMNMEKEQCFV